MVSVALWLNGRL